VAGVDPLAASGPSGGPYKAVDPFGASTQGELLAVGCTAAGCSAVGSFGQSAYVATSEAGAWSMVPIAVPASPRGLNLDGIACRTSSCIAVGLAYDGTSVLPTVATSN
jgi:hypothetical protein